MNKFIFANQLRGIAAILVVMTHYFGTYFAEQQLLAARTFSPVLDLHPSPWVHYFELPYQGPFGVAIFFMISGFVIPFSLQKTGAGAFLLHRVLRIFPTYLCCLGIGMLAVYLSARYWHQPFSIDGATLLGNALLVHNLAGLASLDSVNWTLAIELKFYLLAAALGGALWRRRSGWLLAMPLVILALTLVQQRVLPPLELAPALSTALNALAMDLNYIIFMFAGILFYQHCSGLLTTRGLAWRSVLILTVFGLNWSVGPQNAQFPGITLFYLCGFAVFAACYAARARFKPLALLDFFAAISYPLYTVHTLLGYSLMKILMHRGLAFGAAVPIALTCIVLVATLLHYSVESASNRYGRRLAAGFGRGRLVTT